MTGAKRRDETPTVRLPRMSGIEIKEKETDLFLLIVDAIDRSAREGKVNLFVSPVVIVETLRLCRDQEWTSYARLAGTSVPNAHMRGRLIAFYASGRRDIIGEEVIVEER